MTDEIRKLLKAWRDAAAASVVTTDWRYMIEATDAALAPPAQVKLNEGPMPPAEPNPEFTAWTRTLPARSWARYDLSACRLGWEAARARQWRLDSEAAGLLRSTIGDDEEASEITISCGPITWDKGTVEYGGMVVYMTEHPEEGAIQLVPPMGAL